MKGITKLPSGNYRYRLREGGINYSFTDTRLLSQREIRERFTDIIGERKHEKNQPLAFGTASKRFLGAAKGPYSPATVDRYEESDHALEMLFPAFYGLRIDRITIDHLQKIANEYGETRKPRTVKALIRYIQVVLHRNDIFIQSKVRYKEEDFAAYIPTSEDVKRLFDAVKGTDLEIPVKLAALGLRRSEICGLSMTDFDGKCINIHRSRIVTKGGAIYQERTKTKSSKRTVMLTEDLRKLIAERGEIWKYGPDVLNRRLRTVLKRLGMPHFSFHKLRHYYASQAHLLGVKTAYIMRSGGWATDAVLRSTYTHPLLTEQAAQDKIMVDFLDGFVTNS